MVTIDAVLVDAANDDPAPTPGSPAPGHAHDGARRLRRCSAFSSPEEAARLLLVAGPTAARAESEVRYDKKTQTDSGRQRRCLRRPRLCRCRRTHAQARQAAVLGGHL